MEQVTAFKAPDGSIFLTPVECQDHEFSLVLRERINDFMKSKHNPYPSGDQNTMCGKVVLAWEQFKTGPTSTAQVPLASVPE